MDKECLFCNMVGMPKLKEINLYKDSNKGYLLNIERPLGYIPEHCRNKILYINYCPICGRKLAFDAERN